MAFTFSEVELDRATPPWWWSGSRKMAWQAAKGRRQGRAQSGALGEHRSRPALAVGGNSDESISTALLLSSISSSDSGASYSSPSSYCSSDSSDSSSSSSSSDGGSCGAGGGDF